MATFLSPSESPSSSDQSLPTTPPHSSAPTPDQTSRGSSVGAHQIELQTSNTRELRRQSALLESGRSGETKLYGVCEGQGASNTVCLKELRELHNAHGELLEDLLKVSSETLGTLASLPETSDFFDEFGFDVRQWIEDPETAPEDEIIPLAPLSFPLIGLLSLSHFCITCKTLGQSPKEVRDAFHGVTGHSQGIVAAAAIARSTDWLSFLDSARMAMEILFWIGFECHNRTRSDPLSLETVKECVDAGIGVPSPMLSIRGLDRKSVQKVLNGVNRYLSDDQQVYISLINARDNMVIAGPPNSLHSLSVICEKMKAADGLDQSKVVFNQRKPLLRLQFLPMSSAFHCPRSKHITPFILTQLHSLSLHGEDFGIAVYHTGTGEDLREQGKGDVISCLVSMITADRVDWPTVMQVGKNSVVVEFGQGRLVPLVQKLAEGTGARVIPSSRLLSSPEYLDSKAIDISVPISSRSPCWEEMFKPRLTTNSSGAVTMETKMTRLFGVPPVMVAGMTPTTVSWEFVSSIMRAGYHAELATGGYHSPKSLEKAIVKLSQHIRPTSGITCNIIYANPKAVGWQIPLIQDLVGRGYPIDGLTFGAGVPSAEIVLEYIENMGLKHICFKPGSKDAIMKVIDIAKAHPNFPIGLQWTGGRAGGHHSFEDFHVPILETYAPIRQCENIVLIAGSGFGGAEDTYPYLTGQWSKAMGYPLMPFDGVLLGSRMMVAKEAPTSSQAKALIVHAKGVMDSDWDASYTRPTGGVITVMSEWGQPIHKLATRGVLLWSQLDQKIFSITDRSKRLNELQKNRSWIIERLNKDFQKPWFAINTAGKPVELEDMTYLEVVRRLVQLMYVQSQTRWIDASYQSFVSDFTARSCERLRCATFSADSSLDNPHHLLAIFSKAYPDAETELLHPEDVSYFIGMCGQRGRKPVNFIPRLDGNFEIWFKKDSLWQAEDVEAVPDQDAQRVCIIQGPVAARYSTVVNEPAKTILDNIKNSYVDMLRRDQSSNMGNVPSNEPQIASNRLRASEALATEDTMTTKRYEFHLFGDLPDTETFRESLLNDLSGWAVACISEDFIRQGQLSRYNPIRSAIVPAHGHMLSIIYNADRQVTALVMSVKDSSRAQLRDVLRVSKNDDDSSIVALFTSHESASEVATLQFRFNYNSDLASSKLSEDMGDRNQRIKRFYANLWLGLDSNELQDTSIHQNFSGTPVILTGDLVQQFTKALGSHGMTRYSEMSTGAVAPLEICIVVAWEALVKPLLSPAIDCDLLQLLHRSNQFRYVDHAEKLRVGDTLETSSRIQSVTVQNGNKLVEIIAEIKRNGVTIIEVLSRFFCKGSFANFESTMSRVKEPGYEVFVKSEKECALLMSRQWLEIFCEPKELIGKTLEFNVTSQTTYDKQGQYSSLQVLGGLQANSKGRTESIGKVNFECGSCQSNPVLDFLNRHGYQTRKAVSLQNPGLSGDSSWTIIVPKTNKAYARVSKDTNPIHVSPIFARYARLPGIVNHGMSTAAMVLNVVERAIADADPSRIRRYSASFEGMVLPGDKLKVQIQHVAMIDGRMVLEIQAFNDQSGEKVIEAEAEVEQARTAYLFTGQGSQEKAMGMALYESSKVARILWDDADKYLHETYGFSIIDIVRNDPKNLTVHFGGARGRKIRDNYLAMTIQRVHADGRVVQEPIIRSLTTTSQSYTFNDPRGLLYSTQFAQPALILLEMATFADLESKGMIQEGASYAGHSLGEYTALGALARIMPTESLISLAFYRGLTMQVAMERDQNGRTDFSMIAVNPSRVGKAFNEDSLTHVVKMISKETGKLLEIVNFNVQQRQYVCAGHLRALYTMTQVLNTLARGTNTNVPDEKVLLELVQEQAEAAFELAEPIELEQGIATTPLRGIDVPFHSTYLRSGIPAYRQYLETKILEENIDVDRLATFIPNVMAKPFSIEKEYVEEAARVTESGSLREILDNWDDE
ncbi:beta subunit of fatty acid synthetase [Puttea exsequens]|nr:beta subunit of fatty acid synthetase [Puttea exsequens]